MTIATTALIRPASQALMIACRLLPRPEASTPSLSCRFMFSHGSLRAEGEAIPSFFVRFFHRGDARQKLKDSFGRAAPRNDARSETFTPTIAEREVMSKRIIATY